MNFSRTLDFSLFHGIFIESVLLFHFLPNCFLSLEFNVF